MEFDANDASNLSKQIRSNFGDLSLYEILEVQRDVSDADLKKAYRKMALRHHPDKGGDAEKFKAICVVYAVLSNQDKRREYDETGELDSSDIAMESEGDWYDYFRRMFPKLTKSSIEDFSAQYKNSEEERNDILEAYRNHGGSFNKIMSNVLLAEKDDEDRVMGILMDAIRSGELKMAPKFEKRSKNWVPKISVISRASDRGQMVSGSKSIEQQILLKRKQNIDILGSIAKKYSGMSSSHHFDPLDDISDEDFARTQQQILLNSKKGASHRKEGKTVLKKRS